MCADAMKTECLSTRTIGGADERARSSFPQPRAPSPEGFAGCHPQGTGGPSRCWEGEAS